MALQLGFNGDIRLVDGAEDSLREVLRLSSDKYRAYTEAIETDESDKAVYWRIAFAVLSVHSPIEATFSAYNALRAFHCRFGRMPSPNVGKSLLLRAKGRDGSVTQYCYQKACYLQAFDKQWKSNRALFTRNGDCDNEWRLRLQKNVKGLGLAKASFAVALARPSVADVCCIDTHMFQLFKGKVPTATISRKVYVDIEAKIRALGEEFGLSTFATQWALWDAKRGQSNPHSVLAN